MVETRTPVIGPENIQAYPPDDIDRQWRLITAALRDLIEKAELRDIPHRMLGFCNTSVTEKLPDQFLNAVSNIDKRVARLAERYRTGVTAYLGLPAVPDDLIVPDLKHAKSFFTPDQVRDGLAEQYGKDNPMYESVFNHLVQSGTFLRGITKEERLMIAMRYRYARDVKLLALGAEIEDQKGLTPDENGELVTPSSVRLFIDLDQSIQRSDLLNPQLWSRRRQLHDRVYEIEVNGKKYILKERKTARHTNTTEKHHRNGRLSSREFKIAKHFQENGIVSKGRISVSWERPIGYVAYPDGFSFAVFEYEEDLEEYRSVTSQLGQAIIDHRDQFEEEYQLISHLADKYKNSPEVISLDLDKEVSTQLSFAEFAMVRARRMEGQALSLIHEIIYENGYINSDTLAYSFKVKNGDILKLQITGFDFEYFKNAHPYELAEEIRRFRRWRSGVEGLLDWDDSSPVTRMQQAAYFAILETEGILGR